MKKCSKNGRVLHIMQTVLVTGVVKLFYLIILLPLLPLRTPAPAVFLNYATYSENHQASA